MLPFIVGGVTIAAVVYAVKEALEEEESCYCSGNTYSDEKRDEAKSYERAKAFHKKKKTLYKSCIKEYTNFLQDQNIVLEEKEIPTKLVKQKFGDEMVTDELETYLLQITTTLEILTYNVSLAIKHTKESISKENLNKIKEVMKSISSLAQVEVFTSYETVNTTEVLATLVKAMALTVKKDSIVVTLEV